jgi:hypothetical protein
MFVSGSNFVSVSLSIIGVPDSKASIEGRVKEYRPLFLAMANRISLPDKWK